jgi:O-antigen/teichoic acid export membrane protein
VLSAQLVETIVSAGFFLYVAWLSQTVYGEIMYALAAGVMVLRVVQYGLYYYLIGALNETPRGMVPGILNRVNIIKLALLLPCMAFIWGLALYSGSSSEMAWILFFVSLGLALEAFPETLFADLRFRGEQRIEARIKIASSLIGFGYGFVAALIGLPPVLISLFKVVSSAVRIIGAGWIYLRRYSAHLVAVSDWRNVWAVFRSATVFALIDILANIYTRTNVLFLEGATGLKGVAYYSATWILVDSVSWFTAEQLMGWVILPVLAKLWLSKSEHFGLLIRQTAQWLMAFALPLMFVLGAESGSIIGLIYPAEYGPAIWMQKLLVWTIPLTFVHYLCAYVMMVMGAAGLLLTFSVGAMAINLVLGITLVPSLGLIGGCLLIILTKLVMAALTFGYCQTRLKLFRITDLLYPAGPGCLCLGLFALLEPYAGLHSAVIVSLALYTGILWGTGVKVIGRLPTKEEFAHL